MSANSGPFHYRRIAPHWRMEGATYFVTWRLHADQRDLTNAVKDFIASVLFNFNGERYYLYGYVVMNDHVHAVVRPLADQTLQQILHGWKSFTANRLQREFGRLGAVWQREYIDRILRGEDEFWQKLKYMLENAEKRWPGTKDYKWAAWFKDWETDFNPRCKE